MSGRAIVCVFHGERLPNPEWEYEQEPVTGNRIVEGALVEVTIPGVPFRAPRCDFELPRGGRCTKKSAGGARFAWGVMALCAKHLDEECGPASKAVSP